MLSTLMFQFYFIIGACLSPIIGNNMSPEYRYLVRGVCRTRKKQISGSVGVTLVEIEM
jgi:hypothetical protein